MKLGPLRLRWIAHHQDYDPPHHFRDVQVSGPFSQWEHTHSFEPLAENESALADRIQYRVPGGALGRLLGGRFVSDKLATMFRYRHDRTAADLQLHANHKDQGPMHVAVSGATGLLGGELVPLLTTGGHSVTKLVRSESQEDEVLWDPKADSFDAEPLDGVDAVVHLAGKGIASSRWNDRVKKEIRDSRVLGTRVLCEGLAKMKSPPKVLVCASATGYYGDRGDAKLDEDADAGNGFLVDVCREWEEAAKPAADAGIRVVNARFGMILSPKDGALSSMLTPFKFGVGGVVGSGKQYWSWVSIDDAAGAVLHAVMNEQVQGPMNVVAPDACTNREFTKTLGRVLSRPTFLPMPAFGARLALGEMADKLLLASTRVVPKCLQQTGYDFRHVELEDALRHLLGKSQ